MTSPQRERVASAILLVDGDGDDLRVLLVERAPELRFFGGYHALPGGVQGAEDGANDPSEPSPWADAAPLRRCALREMFEETGVLLDAGLRAVLDPDARTRARAELLQAELARGSHASGTWEHHARPDSGRHELTPLCRIRTPPFAPVRYDTLFFLARLPAGESVEIVDGELVGGGFQRPRDLLAAWRRGELRIVPPVLILLELLEEGDLERFRQRARETTDGYLAGKLHRVRFSPGILLASLRTPTLPPATTTNCAIVGEERLWIIDPATPDVDEQERLFELLDELRAEGRELGGVVVTHHHPDHVGGVAATARRYDLPILAHPITLERLPEPPERAVVLEDGSELELGTAPDGDTSGEPWRLQAVFTPGHDRGHLCFRETRYAGLVAGDMVSTVSTILIDPPEGHLATYLASLEKLLALPIDVLHPAHGPAVPGGHKVLRQYLRHRAQRETALVKALAEGVDTVEELVPRVYWDADKRMHGLAARSLQAGLDKLVEEGRALEKAGRYTPHGSGTG